MRVRRLVTIGVAVLLSATASFAEHERDGGNGIGPIIFSVPQANKREGTPPSISAFGFKLKLLVSKEFPLENPSGVITSFGELSTGVGTEPGSEHLRGVQSQSGRRGQALRLRPSFSFSGTREWRRTWHT